MLKYIEVVKSWFGMPMMELKVETGSQARVKDWQTCDGQQLSILIQETLLQSIVLLGITRIPPSHILKTMGMESHPSQYQITYDAMHATSHPSSVTKNDTSTLQPQLASQFNISKEVMSLENLTADPKDFFCLPHGLLNSIEIQIYEMDGSSVFQCKKPP